MEGDVLRCYREGPTGVAHAVDECSECARPAPVFGNVRAAMRPGEVLSDVAALLPLLSDQGRCEMACAADSACAGYSWTPLLDVAYHASDAAGGCVAGFACCALLARRFPDDTVSSGTGSWIRVWRAASPPCAPPGAVCAAAGQSCVDRNASLGTFECSCAVGGGRRAGRPVERCPDVAGNGTSTADLARTAYGDAVSTGEVLQTMAGWAAFAAAGVDAGPLPALRLVAVARPCSVAGGAAGRYPLALSPLGLRLEGSDTEGAVVGNVLILSVIVLAGSAAVYGGPRAAPRVFEGVDPQGLLRFPSIPLTASLLLYQGTTLAAWNVLFHPPSVSSVCVACAVLAGCVYLPVALHRRLRAAVPTLAYVRDDDTTSRAKIYVYGHGEWVSRDRLLHFVARYAAVMRPYKPRSLHFLYAEFGASFLVSIAAAAAPGTWAGCGHAALACGVVVTALLIAVLRCRPYMLSRTRLLEIAALALLMVAMFSWAGAFYTGDPNASGFDVGAWCLEAAAVAVLTRAATDVAIAGYMKWTGRRRRVQEQEFDRCAEEGILDMDRELIQSPPYPRSPPTPLSISVGLASDDPDACSMVEIAASTTEDATTPTKPVRKRKRASATIAHAATLTLSPPVKEFMKDKGVRKAPPLKLSVTTDAPPDALSMSVSSFLDIAPGAEDADTAGASCSGSVPRSTPRAAARGGARGKRSRSPFDVSTFTSLGAGGQAPWPAPMPPAGRQRGHTATAGRLGIPGVPVDLDASCVSLGSDSRRRSSAASTCTPSPSTTPPRRHRVSNASMLSLADHSARGVRASLDSSVPSPGKAEPAHPDGADSSTPRTTSGTPRRLTAVGQSLEAPSSAFGDRDPNAGRRQSGPPLMPLTPSAGKRRVSAVAPAVPGTPVTPAGGKKRRRGILSPTELGSP
eukprot:TRINITY_DN14385_c0_g1_i1.p1 TRINITY_DN14385_c0_g1~~TRINITY_DN14385_c0_g1_i1.p1  ORF type:complete len:970 (+),score=176.00 TRINITY_DN14385_c0_g1_i1:176-2911(+)